MQGRSSKVIFKRVNPLHSWRELKFVDHPLTFKQTWILNEPPGNGPKSPSTTNRDVDSLSYTITGGAARQEKVKPKTWRILASADATWYLRLQVFTTDQPRCYAFDKVLSPWFLQKKIVAFLFSRQIFKKNSFFRLLTQELVKIMRKCFF